MTIDEYILSHSDEEGALLSALNRDANVNLLRPRMLSGHLLLFVWRKGWKKGL